MRLVTWNVMSGRSLLDGRADKRRLYDALASLDADVLALQEVDQNQPRTDLLDVTAVAAAATDAVAARFAASVIGTPGVGWQPAGESDFDDDDRRRSDYHHEDVRGGDHEGDDRPRDHDARPRFGVALVSRWPVQRWYLRRLRAAPVRAPIWVPGPGGGLVMVDDEPRAVLAAVIDAPTGRMTVA